MSGALLQTIERLLRELELVGPNEVIESETGLLGRGVGLDSVEVLQLVSGLEEAFDLTVDDEELEVEHFRTVGSVARWLEAKLP